MEKEPFVPSPQQMPEREEFRDLPQAPHLLMNVSRLLRHRVRNGDPTEGVMNQHAARILMAHLAILTKASQLTLAEKTQFSTPTVSILLRKMEQEGYVQRTPDPKDRRVMLVSPTKKGIAYDREHFNRILENDRRATAGFTPEEETQLVSFLSRMYNNLKEK